MWLLAGIKHTFSFLPTELVYKLPANIADTVIAYLVWRFVSQRWGELKGMLAALLYVLNPLTWYISALWGQMDAVQVLLMILSLMALFGGRLVYAAVIFSSVVLFKPHSVIIAPIFLIYLWVNRDSYKGFIRKLLILLSVGMASVWVNSLPFSLSRLNFLEPSSVLLEPLKLVWQRYIVAIDLYPFASVSAFNFWYVFIGDRLTDSTTFIGVSYQSWGIMLFLLFLSVLLAFFILKRGEAVSPASYYFAASLLALLAFTFLTRVHERHIYPFFALFAFGLFQSRHRAKYYVAITGIALANSIYVFEWYSTRFSHTFVFSALSLLLVMLSILLLRDLIKTSDG